MIVPTKFVSFDESILSALPAVLVAIDGSTSLVSLYKATRKRFDGVEQFILALDTLHALGAVNVDINTRTVRLAHSD